MDTSSAGGYGVQGTSTNGSGVYGVTTSATGYGVEGTTTTGTGVCGATSANGQSGVEGSDTSSGGGYGVKGISTNGTGVYGQSTGSWATFADGNAYVSGNLSVGGNLNLTGTLSGGTGIINVLTFGADPSGVVDSTTAIQSAIDLATGPSAASSTIRVPIAPVFLPAGTYKISADLVIQSTRGFHLFGAGVESTIAAGVDVRTVAGRLGHADPTTTLNIYSGFLAERDRAAADILGARLAPPHA